MDKQQYKNITYQNNVQYFDAINSGIYLTSVSMILTCEQICKWFYSANPGVGQNIVLVNPQI